MDKVRKNESLLYNYERKVLLFLAKRIPNFIGPDHLTLLAFLSAVAIFLIYIYAPYNKNLLLLGILFYFLHWLGDSLDGTLARVRKKERPRYGYYLDHMLDSISLVLIMGGITISSFTETTIWLWALVGALLIFIHSFLFTAVTNIFEMSIGILGPTEARILGSLFNLILYFYGNPVIIYNFKLEPIVNTNLRLADCFGMAAAIVLWIVLVLKVARAAIYLNRLDNMK